MLRSGDVADHQASIRAPGRVGWTLFAIVIIALTTAVVISAFSRTPAGEPGVLTEPRFDRPADLRMPDLVDATDAWGLGDATMSNRADQMAGGAVAVDLDRDGRLELVVANGDVAIRRFTGGAFGEPAVLDVTGAMGVTSADVDRDGWADLLIARAVDDDVIVWGHDGLAAGDATERTVLEAPGASSALLAADLDDDDHVDIVRLGRHDAWNQPVPELLWVGDGGRAFVSMELPVTDRYTLAGTLVDADGDGLVDVWVTRDLGWVHGGDSVLSRRGDATGPWFDVAPTLGVDVEIDGMGITIADLDLAGGLDAYLSDIGDNEMFVTVGDGFERAEGRGAARVRPAGSEGSVVSSSWATGPTDINLDGVTDLIVVGGGFPVGAVRNKIDDTSVIVAEPPAVLLGLGDGRYVDVWPDLSIDLELTARGMTLADIDADGDDDIIIVGRLGDLVALENRSAGPTLTVTTSSCETLGASVEVDTVGRPHHVLVDRHTYAGQHGREVIVGAPTGRATVIVHVPGAEPDPVELVVPGRLHHRIDC